MIGEGKQRYWGGGRGRERVISVRRGTQGEMIELIWNILI